MRLGGICPAARCRGALVPWRICGRKCRDERLRDLAVLPRAAVVPAQRIGGGIGTSHAARRIVAAIPRRAAMGARMEHVMDKAGGIEH